MRRANFTFAILVFGSVLAKPLLGADVQLGQGGHLLRFADPIPAQSDVGRSEETALSDFMEKYYGKFGSYHWSEKSVVSDRDHKHHTYALKYQGRRVVDALLKVHYRREGWVDSASANFEPQLNVQLPTAAETEQNRKRITSELRKNLLQTHGVVPNLIELEPVLWRHPDVDSVIPAFEVTVVHDRPHFFRKLFISETSGRIIEERPVMRHFEPRVDQKVYKIDPDRGSLTSQTLPSLISGSTLKSNLIHVRREQDISSLTQLDLVDVDPATDFTGAGFETDPDNYDHVCKGDSKSCPNQGFEAQNVYYHSQLYREYIDSVYSDLGVTVDFQPVQLDIIVNFLLQDQNGVIDANSAAFVSSYCDSAKTIEKCILFLRPAPVDDPICGGVAKFYHLAREALVIAHEYQHFITDTVTQMVPGGEVLAGVKQKYNVGDALHEGYSDYMAASHVSSLNGTDITYVGAYSFKNCMAVAREIGTPKVYVDDPNDPGPHVYGQSWASGLWQLRKEFGQTVADKIVLKSQFLIPSQPGFVDAVESLVKADQVLFAGEHVSRIRKLFYDEIRFVAGYNSIFRDASSGVVEMGIHGCASVSGKSTGSQGHRSQIAWSFIIVSLLLALGVGRRCVG